MFARTGLGRAAGREKVPPFVLGQGRAQPLTAAPGTVSERGAERPNQAEGGLIVRTIGGIAGGCRCAAECQKVEGKGTWLGKLNMSPKGRWWW